MGRVLLLWWWVVANKRRAMFLHFMNDGGNVEASAPRFEVEPLRPTARQYITQGCVYLFIYLLGLTFKWAKNLCILRRGSVCIT
jgi:hypothetical protein